MDRGLSVHMNMNRRLPTPCRHHLCPCLQNLVKRYWKKLIIFKNFTFVSTELHKSGNYLQNAHALFLGGKHGLLMNISMMNS